MKYKYSVIFLIFLISGIGFFLTKKENSPIRSGSQLESDSMPSQEKVKGLLTPGDTRLYTHAEFETLTDVEKRQHLDFMANAVGGPIVSMVEKIDKEILDEIRSSFELLKPILPWNLELPIQDISNGITVIRSSEVHLKIDKAPKIGYSDSDYYFYADVDSDDFMKGYAVKKASGELYRWDLSNEK